MHELRLHLLAQAETGYEVLASVHASSQIEKHGSKWLPTLAPLEIHRADILPEFVPR